MSYDSWKQIGKQCIADLTIYEKSISSQYLFQRQSQTKFILKGISSHVDLNPLFVNN